jgi:hypothetical protein
MMNLAQAAARRGAAGVPLPTVYQTLANAEVNICRGQLTLIVGPPSAGKSLLGMNLLYGMGQPALAFLLDVDQLSAAARFAAIMTGDEFSKAKAGIDNYREQLAGKCGHIQTAFYGRELEDVHLQMDAFSQRMGLPPEVMLVDNLGNMSSAFDGEWAVLKAATLELDELARSEQTAVIATAHTTDLDTCEPAQRTKILGKISQYARLILSVGYNDITHEFKIAVVKNSSGPSDIRAERPLTLWAKPSCMALTENPQLGHSWGGRPTWPIDYR